MISFRSYTPSFFTGFEVEEFECETIEELLKKKKGCLSNHGRKYFRFATDDFGNKLMVSSKEKEEWYVVGTVKGCDLREKLPQFDEVCEVRCPVCKSRKFSEIDFENNGFGVASIRGIGNVDFVCCNKCGCLFAPERTLKKIRNEGK